MLLRWVSDQYGAAHPGGEQGLQRALVDGSATGYAAHAAATGEPADSLLAMWAASLYVDDRVAGANPRLTIPSWNLLDVFEGTFGGQRINANARLVPADRGFATFSDQLSVRAGSSSYARLSSAGRPATAVRIRSGGGGALPGYMHVWVVRLR
jgi:hypothetical protein